jgi:hypothetical protein
MIKAMSRVLLSAALLAFLSGSSLAQQAKPEHQHPVTEKAMPGQALPDHPQPGQAMPEHMKPGQAMPDHPQPGQMQPLHPQSGQMQPDHPKSEHPK